MKLDSSHIQYILECLKENGTQMMNMAGICRVMCGFCLMSLRTSA